ncbi:2TM domain-containing protein [Acidovorax sp. GBBC 3334]|uniref:2TM domain-containing protein n=1 Tax=Acidovorax sp. GBBC 3334 TaxID=2940496 RepID=UPI00230370CA|nr:2TM domain-containing protein [Acidovorax sp. GBBC 3334]MDA8457234.1 2TM domain-containing protein [Acidovorax sp. GBBC 3334]
MPLEPTTASCTAAQDRLAHRRARAKLGWLLHASVYVCVNLGLAALAAWQGRHWAVFPALGWGIGLLAHGVAVALRGRGVGLYERLLERERAALVRQGRT